MTKKILSFKIEKDGKSSVAIDLIDFKQKKIYWRYVTDIKKEDSFKDVKIFVWVQEPQGGEGKWIEIYKGG